MQVTFTKLLLSFGSGLMSLLDVGFDISTILYLENLGNHELANLMGLFVVLSIFLQLCLTFGVHYQNLRIFAREFFFTVTFLKPAVNKFRVLTDSKLEEHAIMPPVSEMVMFKMCEVFSEAIPMSVLQVINLLEQVSERSERDFLQKSAKRLTSPKPLLNYSCSQKC